MGREKGNNGGPGSSSKKEDSLMKRGRGKHWVQSQTRSFEGEIRVFGKGLLLDEESLKGNLNPTRVDVLALVGGRGDRGVEDVDYVTMPHLGGQVEECGGDHPHQLHLIPGQTTFQSGGNPLTSIGLKDVGVDKQGTYVGGAEHILGIIV